MMVSPFKLHERVGTMCSFLPDPHSHASSLRYRTGAAGCEPRLKRRVVDIVILVYYQWARHGWDIAVDNSWECPTWSDSRCGSEGNSRHVWCMWLLVRRGNTGEEANGSGGFVWDWSAQASWRQKAGFQDRSATGFIHAIGCDTFLVTKWGLNVVWSGYFHGLGLAVLTRIGLPHVYIQFKTLIAH